MNRTFDDEIESALADLFERQAGALPVDGRVWDDAPMVTTNDIATPRRSRPAIAAIVAVAAAIAVVVGVVAIAPGGNRVYVAGQPGSPAAVRFATPQVSLAADGLQIDAGGQRFSAAGSTVDVHSDPGTPGKYTTLELTWTERGVEMRLNIYFASDGIKWWANEMRTYNGKSPGDWIEYAGTYFTSPLGTAFTGDVDLPATDGHGRLRLTNLRLQPFLPPAACTNATTPYALNPQYDRVDMPAGADGFGLGVTSLLDTAQCKPVADPHAFSYDWTIDDTAVAKILLDADKPSLARLLGADPSTSMNLVRTGPGTTTLHVVAHRRSDGRVVGSADIPVTAG